MTRDRSGAAIVLAVVLSLAGVLLAHGTLALARADILSARLSSRVIQAEYSARAAALDAFGSLSSASGEPPEADSATGGGEDVRGVGRIVMLSPEILWVEGEGRAGPVARTGGFLAWRLEPAHRVDRLGGVVVTDRSATLSGTSGIDATAHLGPTDPEPPGGCVSEAAADSTVPPAPWGFADLDSAGAVLGYFDAGGLASLAELRVSGAGTPAPVGRGAECVENPWNWGDPGGSSRPCAERMRLVAVDEGTVVSGGRGQGVLVARGDLTLRDTKYFGLVIVQGVLRLEGEARLTGGAIAVSGGHVGPDARVVGSRCWLLSALGLPELRAPIAIEPVRWIRLEG